MQKVSEEGGEEVLQGLEHSLQPMVKPTVRQAVPLQPMEGHGGAEIPLQPMEVCDGAEIPLQPMEGHGGAEIPLQPMEVCDGAEIPLQPMEDPVPEQVDAQRSLGSRGKPMLEQASGRTCGPMERGAHTGAGLYGYLRNVAGFPGGPPWMADVRHFSGSTVLCCHPCEFNPPVQQQQGGGWLHRRTFARHKCPCQWSKRLISSWQPERKVLDTFMQV